VLAHLSSLFWIFYQHEAMQEENGVMCPTPELVREKRSHLAHLTCSNGVRFSTAVDSPHSLSLVCLSGTMPMRSGGPRRRICSAHYKLYSLLSCRSDAGGNGNAR